jgi:protein required for attachment to host cells
MASFGRTLIVVLDESRVRFFRRESSGKLADGLPEVAAEAGSKGAGGLADRKERQQRFLGEVMEALDTACNRSECDRLMVVGPDRMLSAFRKTAPDKVRARFWREAAMDVKDIGQDELEKRLGPHFR